MAKGEDKFGVKTVVKLVLASLGVGVVMASLDISPKEFWEGAFNWLAGGWEWMTESFEGALIYVVTGAAVVVPIWLVRLVMNKSKARKSTPVPADPPDSA